MGNFSGIKEPGFGLNIFCVSGRVMKRQRRIDMSSSAYGNYYRRYALASKHRGLAFLWKVFLMPPVCLEFNIFCYHTTALLCQVSWLRIQTLVRLVKC
jgi:hypothetical protein